MTLQAVKDAHYIDKPKNYYYHKIFIGTKSNTILWTSQYFVIKFYVAGLFLYPLKKSEAF